MDKTIYWAVLLNNESKIELLSSKPPVHPNVYAEHTTIVFKPTAEQDQELEERLGEDVRLVAIGTAEDDKGDAVVVSGVKRYDDKTPHITISCANGVKPFYSNKLIDNGWDKLENPIHLNGKIAKFTNHGWVTEPK
jgi:hypothetical protein